jgi:hypothetical protein
MLGPASLTLSSPLLFLPSLIPVTRADFGLILTKCKERKYTSVRQWLADASLVTDNSRLFNKPDTDYYQCAKKVDIFINAKLRSGAWNSAPTTGRA